MPARPKPPLWYFFAASDPPEISRDAVSWVIPIYCQVKFPIVSYFLCVLGASTTGANIVILARGSALVEIPCNCEKQNVELPGRLCGLVEREDFRGVLDKRAGHDRPLCERSCCLR